MLTVSPVPQLRVMDLCNHSIQQCLERKYNMKDTKLIMGMPITVEIADQNADENALALAFDYFRYVDEKFSTYKDTSEITKINKGELKEKDYSYDMKEIFKLSEKTKVETDGYFDIRKPDNSLDPSGMVKGWSIHNAALILKKNDYKNFCLEAGGDIETFGNNDKGEPWTVGICNPFKKEEIVKVLEIKDKGVATSGTYIRGQHIYNPKNQKNKNEKIEDIVSLTVIGPDIYE